MSFKEDLQTFIDFLKNNDDHESAKKEYRRLIKTYHPDHAPEQDKELYNDYILLINKVYAAGKTKTKETEIETEPQSKSKVYTFTRKGLDGKDYVYKCANYFDYLYKVARNEYHTGHEMLHFHHLNYMDRKAIDQNSLEVMQHYWNAIKCYKFILKNCKDPVILSSTDFELKMTQDAVNNLARSLTASDGKGLAIS